MDKVRIYVDQDGTLCEFKKNSSMEDLYKKGYFRHLLPHKNILSATKKLLDLDRYEIYLLSSVLMDHRTVVEEK